MLWNLPRKVAGRRSNPYKDVVRYAKGIAERPPEMCWIDYGLTALCRRVLAECVPADTVFDLAPVLSGLAAEGQLAGCEVPDRFYEIGSPQGRGELEALLREQRSRRSASSRKSDVDRAQS